MAELLELRGVSKSYLRGKRRLRVLRDVSLSVGSGEIVAVVGSRYEGKTTLLTIASGFVQPDTGEVWLDGRELTGMSLRAREELWREEIAWVSREDASLGFEMLDYVALRLRFGRRPPSVADEAALAALERVGLASAARRRWEELSNLERVLVAIARGIVGKPRLLVIDDVMDGLGASKTRETGELLCSLARELGCGVLMSASDPEATLLVDRVWSFAGGGLRLLADQSEGSTNLVQFPGGTADEGRGSSGLGS